MPEKTYLLNLEPEEEYELIGYVNNVVFPEGAYINNGTLFV